MLCLESYVPLTLNEDGVCRVTGTRVNLESIVGAFDEGETPEEIVQNFPVLELRDVYAVITFYLRNLEPVRAYLAEQDREANRVRDSIRAEIPTNHLRARVLDHRRESAAKGSA